jgi:hypothetical protein
MVGRVLRGPLAGGEPEAHVVHFRDVWKNLPDILSPEEVLPAVQQGPEGRDAPRWTPGPIVDDSEEPLPPGFAAQVARLLAQARSLFDLSDDDPFNDRPLAPLVFGSRIVGYYDAGELLVPVFEHQTDAYEQLLADALESKLKGTAFLSYFEDTPPPYPHQRSLRVLVELTREYGEIPVLKQSSATIGPRVAANAVLRAGPLTDEQRADIIMRHYVCSINRAVFPSIEHFEDAVNQELRQLRRAVPRLEAESPIRAGEVDASALPVLPRADRVLKPILEETIARARGLLPPDLGELLHRPPRVAWTKRFSQSTWAHWSLQLTGPAKGTAIIRVNRVLQTPAQHVPDEMLSYLLYHELLHHVLPGQGHDAEFRYFEALWPDAARWDCEFDTLHERWDLRPKSYVADDEGAG